MQDYVDEKTMALVVKGGKITARILREGIKDFMKIEHKVKDKAHTGSQRYYQTGNPQYPQEKQ